MSEGRLTEHQCARLGGLILTALSTEYQYSEVLRTSEDPRAMAKSASVSREAQKALWKYVYGHLLHGRPE
jgi:hypothetical protein